MKALSRVVVAASMVLAVADAHAAAPQPVSKPALPSAVADPGPSRVDPPSSAPLVREDGPVPLPRVKPTLPGPVPMPRVRPARPGPVEMPRVGEEDEALLPQGVEPGPD